MRSHNLIRLVGQAHSLIIKEISFWVAGDEEKVEEVHFFQGELGP